MLIVLASALEARQDAAAELNRQAEELHLWSSSGWLRLLHYPYGGIAAGRSRVDSADFFLSPTGAVDPQAEGRASIEAMVAHSASFTPPETSFACRYPARSAYIRKKLRLAETGVAGCPELARWLASFDAAGVSMVYVDGYLNNPASMFGHTFLRVESEEFAEDPLLSGSIGFAAVTNETPGVMYAFNGIFGGYQAEFSAEPYDEKVREYGAVENRDIWEHHLDLTPEETRFLLLHVWELQRAGYEYYFFDENCSYQVLALLEAARPTLHLTDHFPLWALPADTFRSTVYALGKGTTRFRPSRKTTISHRQRLMSAADVAAARKLAAGDLKADSTVISRLPEDRRRGVLALASEYLLYLNSKKGGLSGRDNRRFMEILRVRSQLQVNSLEPDPPASPGPLASHGTSRLAFALGVDDGFYLGLGFRPALHDILDPLQGYQQGAQIQLFEPKIRFYPEKNRLELQSLTLVDILSIPQRSRLLAPVSWRALLDGRRVHYPQGRKLTGEGRVGFGLSLPLDSRISGYGLLGAAVLLNDYFPALVDGGPTLTCGITANLSSSWNILFQGDLAYYALAEQRWVSHLILGQGYSLDNSNGLRLNLSYSREFSAPSLALSLSWLHYF